MKPPNIPGRCAAGCWLDAVGFLEVAGQLNGLLEGQTDDLVAELLDVFCDFCHDFFSEPYRGSTVSNTLVPPENSLHAEAI